MENLQPNEVPELEQPDFLAELEPPKPKREANIIPMFDQEDDYVCKECGNSNPGCEYCHGRNFQPSK